MKRAVPNNPKVSCIVPSFNRRVLVRDTIESIKEQTLEDFEAIITDDDSNAETLATIYRVIDGDPRFVVIEQAGGRPTPEQRAAGPARYCITINRGLTACRGDYVCSIPDDDYFYTTAFEKLSRTLDENPDVHVVYGRMRSLSMDVSVEWDSCGVPRPGRSYPLYGEIDPETGKPVNPATWQPGIMYPIKGLDHSQFMWRRSCHEELGGGKLWPEVDARQDVGDAAWLRRLSGIGHGALACDTMVTVKRFHGRSYGRVGTSLVRE